MTGKLANQACRELEEIILLELLSTAEEGWVIFPRGIANTLEIDIRVVKAVCHCLRDAGLIQLGRCFNEDGRVAGSGYQLTSSMGVPKAREVAAQLRKDGKL